MILCVVCRVGSVYPLKPHPCHDPLCCVQGCFCVSPETTPISQFSMLCPGLILCIPWNQAHVTILCCVQGCFCVYPETMPIAILLCGRPLGSSHWWALCFLRYFLGISWTRTRCSLLPACTLWFVMWFGHEASLPSQKCTILTWQSYYEETLESRLEISPLGSGHRGWPIPDLLLSLSASWLPQGEQPTPPNPLPGCSDSPQT